MPEFFSSEVYKTGRFVWTLEQLSSAIGGGARTLVRQLLVLGQFQSTNVSYPGSLSVKTTKGVSSKTLLTISCVLTYCSFSGLWGNASSNASKAVRSSHTDMHTQSCFVNILLHGVRTVSNCDPVVVQFWPKLCLLFAPTRLPLNHISLDLPHHHAK